MKKFAKTGNFSSNFDNSLVVIVTPRTAFDRFDIDLLEIPNKNNI